MFITAEEAIARGIPMAHEAPPPDVCRFCGKITHRQGIIICGVVQFWQPEAERCDCAAAQIFYRQEDQRLAKEREAEAEQKRNAAMQERIERLLGQSGIKKRFQQRTFEHFKTDTEGRKKAYGIAKKYADNFADHRCRGEGLYFEGTNGTGKTHLAAAIALQLMHQGTPAICKTAADLLADIKKAFSVPEVKEHEVLAVYKTVDLLVIDDLGKELCTDWSLSTLYTIINDRYEDMKPTIITTNYNAQNLIQALTPKGCDDLKASAIISRLKEVNKVVTMAWTDCRGG